MEKDNGVSHKVEPEAMEDKGQGTELGRSLTKEHNFG